tara:strand:- start:685 stop:831 length:147 start_codon:yes stop_codon:yes gene_type:complete
MARAVVEVEGAVKGIKAVKLKVEIMRELADKVNDASTRLSREVNEFGE